MVVFNSRYVRVYVQNFFFYIFRLFLNSKATKHVASVGLRTNDGLGFGSPVDPKITLGLSF